MRKGTDKDWEQRAGCMTFPDAVAKELLKLAASWDHHHGPMVRQKGMGETWKPENIIHHRNQDFFS